jgi:hypothetical protein
VRGRSDGWFCRDVARRAGGAPVVMAVEGCTGWRFVVVEIVAARFEAHTWRSRPTRGGASRKRHAKTDRLDARMLRESLQSGDLPESWIPPIDMLEWHERMRLHKSLVDQREWIQRNQAKLFQCGVTVHEGAIRSTTSRYRLLSDDVSERRATSSGSAAPPHRHTPATSSPILRTPDLAPTPPRRN